jgi:hypothetical protein
MKQVIKNLKHWAPWEAGLLLTSANIGMAAATISTSPKPEVMLGMFIASIGGIVSMVPYALNGMIKDAKAYYESAASEKSALHLKTINKGFLTIGCTVLTLISTEVLHAVQCKEYQRQISSGEYPKKPTTPQLRSILR